MGAEDDDSIMVNLLLFWVTACLQRGVSLLTTFTSEMVMIKLMDNMVSSVSG